jgi:Ser/Thr protein kinase RdoA (MazF antagonist)
VVAPVPRRDGDVVGTIEASEGARFAALFEFAPGSPKESDVDDLRALGEMCAGIHEAASSFVTEHSRYSLDADLLLEMPVREVSAFLDGSRGEDIKLLRMLVDRVREQIETIPMDEPAFGVIHADLHGGNCHWTQGRPTILDFDHCGYGWRAYDFVAAFDSDADDKRDSFIEGYRSARDISKLEVDLLPAFHKARYIWNYGDILAMADHLGVRGRLNEAFWDRYFEQIRKMLEDYV